MALSLSIDSRLSASFSASLFSSSASSFPKLTGTLEPKTVAVRRIHLVSSPSKPVLGFSNFPPVALNTRSIQTRKTSRSSLSAHGSTPSGNNGNGEEPLTSERSRNHPADIKSLVRVYKEALATGDDKTLNEIETIICSIEKIKNSLDQKVLSLSTEISSSKEKSIRLQADFDNFRKKSDKDRLMTQSNARRHVMESLLPMVDSFEKLRQQTKPESEKEKKIDTSYQGIYRQFVELLRSLNISVIPTVGKPFDPLLHEAIAREASLDFKEGIVVQELQRGFVLEDRVLRPAKVKVSAGKSSTLPTEKSAAGQPAAAGGVDDR